MRADSHDQHPALDGCDGLADHRFDDFRLIRVTAQGSMEPTPLGEEHPEAVEGKGGGLKSRELGEDLGNLPTPIIEGLMASHEVSLPDGGGW
jgi:hypothetical protein